ncbi:MAG: class I SAM-dependent methyltransferase, partial [Bacteroidales bacterium]
MVHYDKCPLCHSAETGEYLKTADYFLTGEKFVLVKCSQCGFIFTQDHPGSDETGRYYESADYISHNDSAPGFFASIYRIAREFMLKRKRNMVCKATGLKNGNILDIGSGTGHFLSVMQNSGWKAKGIEINDKAREFSVSEFRLEVLPPAGIGSLPSDSFDAITLWHVLEHLQDPFIYASEIGRLLKPGGACLIALPNCSSYDARHYKEFWAAYDVPRHLWHFTPETFSLFAEKNGLSIRSIRTLPLDVFYISILSGKYKKTRLSFIKGVFEGLWFCFRASFNRKRSSSLIYLLQKQ